MTGCPTTTAEEGESSATPEVVATDAPQSAEADTAAGKASTRKDDEDSGVPGSSDQPNATEGDSKVPEPNLDDHLAGDAGTLIDNSEDDEGEQMSDASGSPNDSSETAAESTDAENVAPSLSPAQALSAPETLRAVGDSSVELTLSSVVEASIQANGGEELVVTGTLSEEGDTLVYTPGPEDHLRIVWQQGPPTELHVAALDGDFAASSVDDFLAKDHLVDVQVVREGNADLRVVSAAEGGRNEALLQGKLTLDGVPYTADVFSSGTFASEFGAGTLSYDSTQNTSGTISAPGLSLSVDESYEVHMVRVDRLVIDRTRTARSHWVSSEDEYVLDDLLIRTTTSDGKPVEPDFWRSQGELYENGQLYGQLALRESTAAIEVVLNLSDGETVVLDRFLR